MNRCIRLRSRSLVILLFFVTSLAFAFPFPWSPHLSSGDESAPPDTTYSPNSPAADSVYRQLIVTGNLLFNQRDYEACLSVLKKAQAIKPGVASVQDRILQVEGLLAQKQKNQAEYDRLIKLAGDYFAKKDYLNAKASFQLALDIKPDDAYAREQLGRTMEVLRSQKAQNILYDVAIANADKLFSAGEYDRARTEYENACRILPEEAYPKEKINAIIKIMVDRQVREQLYAEAIAAADRFYGLASYQRALLEYQKALQQKPDEPYPKERIAGLQQILAELAALEKAYKEAVTQGDQLLSQRLYMDARSAYEEALGIKPKEPYPADKIREIDGILAGIARSDAEYDRFLNLADSLYIAKNFIRARQNYQLALQVKPGESYPLAMLAKTEAGVGEQQANALALEEAYVSAIADADKLFANHALAEAKTAYGNALAIKPGEPYPQQKIHEIGELQAAADRETRDANYASLISGADAKLALLEYQQAKAAYQEALSLKPKESYPSAKIKEIDDILEADLARLQSLNQQYEKVIASADQLFSGAQWTQAKRDYEKALALKPGETYPTGQLALIEEKLAEAARLQALEKEYQGIIAKGERQLRARVYDSARMTFVAAQNLKPAETIPAARIARIDSILHAIVAQQALDEEYSAVITAADQLFEQQDYPAAMQRYRQALDLKPAMQYPQEKIAEMEGIFARRQALDKKYEEEVATGDRMFADRSWDPAVTAYQRALALKPSELYPAGKIAEIDSTRQEIARQLGLDEVYRQIITGADRLFGAKSYDSARVEFTRAGEVRPEKTYWQEQIAQIDRIQAEIRRQNEEYLAAITRGDGLLAEKQYEQARESYQNASLVKPAEAYPREKIREVNQILAEIQGRRQTFDKLVSGGDQFLAFREFVKARESYQQALELFPDETYPKNQLRLVSIRIDSIYRANKADYDKAVGEGDGFFNTFEYDRAIDAYTRATGFLPMEAYPREMIAKIRKTISENAIADVLSAPVIIKAGEEQKFPFDPVNIAARRNNFIYLKVKNLTSSNFNILIRYGRGDQTNGGLAIRTISTDGEVNERLISVKDQDPWYREDNNWISIYPQGGEIEVSFIQVSRAIK